MGLILRYVTTTKAGTWHYRRRFPHDVLEVIGKGEFKRRLGSTEREALRNYPAINLQFERLVQEARDSRVARGKPTTPLEAHLLAEQRAKELEAQTVHLGGLALSPGDSPLAADIIRDSYLSSLPVDPETGYPVGGDPIEGAALSILIASEDVERPAPTLADAQKLYLAERIGGDRRRQNQMVHVFRVVQAALDGEDKPLTHLRREDARKVRDHMRRGLTPSSINRYLNVVRAVINYALREFDLQDVSNPFMHLDAGPRTNDAPDTAARRPFTPEEAEAVSKRLASRANLTLQRIWAILDGTGCRLGEVCGLRLSDVRLDHDIPHIIVEWHDERRIKNLSSRRPVPLIGAALAAAKEAVAAATPQSPMLFPQYGREGGPASASAALGKHVRTCISDPRATTHSLRHLMKDRLRLADVQQSDQNLVLGHSGGSVGETYGRSEAALLRVAERALKAALNE